MKNLFTAKDYATNQKSNGRTKERTFDDFLEMVRSIKDPELFDEFMNAITTASERKALARRVEIIERLLEGQSQHEIAGDLGVGIATVTRGSRELQRGKFMVMRNKK